MKKKAMNKMPSPMTNAQQQQLLNNAPQMPNLVQTNAQMQMPLPQQTQQIQQIQQPQVQITSVTPVNSNRNVQGGVYGSRRQMPMN